jgi:hypothetical protein
VAEILIGDGVADLVGEINQGNETLSLRDNRCDLKNVFTG